MTDYGYEGSGSYNPFPATINPQPKTWTVQGMQTRYELEVLEDRICDLYSGQDNGILYKKMTEDGREAVREFLDSWIDDFRAWRKKNGLEYL